MIDPVDFVTIWQKSESLAAVAKAFGITTAYATMKASGYRKRGVKLKRFQRGTPFKPLDITYLNRIAQKAVSA